jgi:hypothetical protein
MYLKARLRIAPMEKKEKIVSVGKDVTKLNSVYC